MVVGIIGNKEKDFSFFRSIRGKLILGLSAVLLLGVLATMAAIYGIWRMEDKIKIIESFYDLNQKVLEMRRYEKNFILFNDIKDLTSALDYINQVRSSIGYIKRFMPEKIHWTGSSYNQLLSEYENIFHELVKKNIPKKKKITFYNQLRVRGHNLTLQLFKMNDKARLQVEEKVRGYLTISFFILGIAIISGGFFVTFLVHWIMKPLETIRDAVFSIRKGELASIPINNDIRRSVEVIGLVNSLNMMLKTLDEKQNQLVQSAKLAAIGKISAGIAHEINNPLNNISLTAEVLLEDLANIDCDERMEMVHDIVVQSDRAREVVHNLLEFTRGKDSDKIEKIDIVLLARNSIALLKNQFRLDQITCRFKDSPGSIIIIGNSNQLKQVLVNVFLNSIQAMGPGGLLSVQADRDEAENKGVLTIKDNGSGIPKEIQGHIFDPFFTTKNDGTGLGLSLSFTIIKEHSGEIELESEEGKGTIFRIRLPLASPE